VLQRLGDRTILDYVLANARQVVSADDLYVVVGDRQDEVRAQLGNQCHYVVQSEPLGTGHAVRQMSPVLKGYQSNLLILYGDTPLFRPASIRGLLNRHALRQAHLTLLTAISARPLPYGRIIRDAAGRIVDIIEEIEASPAVREIHELNVGAYIVSAPAIFSALERLAPAPDGRYQLTDCVTNSSARGCGSRATRSVTRMKSRDQHPPGPGAGEFILQKRLFRPRREEEQHQVAFGTGGWRAIIGEGFTLHNVRACRRRSPTRSRAGARKNAACSSATTAASFPTAPATPPPRSLPEQHPRHAAERRRAHAAYHLRDGDSETLPMAWRLPPATIRPNGTALRFFTATARCSWTTRRSRSRSRRTGSLSRRSSRLTWISPWRAAPSGAGISPTIRGRGGSLD